MTAARAPHCIYPARGLRAAAAGSRAASATSAAVNLTRSVSGVVHVFIERLYVDSSTIV